MKNERQPLLIVEDDPGLTRQLRWSLEKYDPVFAADREEALKQVRQHQPSVVLQDLGLPPDPNGTAEGMACMQDILRLAPDTKIIVVTGNGDQSSAVRAIGLGAWDFYAKPPDLDVLEVIIDRAQHIWELEQEHKALQRRDVSPLADIIAASRNMLAVLRQVEKVAPTRATTLIQGETGTGKELIARALHRLSDRADQPFVAINCAAIPDTLLESELFGYEKGAFTGAARQTPGKIELADQGTLFLDEIGDMPLDLQAKLLRFLQERVIERLGGRNEIPVDVRILCATHRDVSELIKTGAFREDLYYRVSEIVIHIPPLRERDGDAVPIAQELLRRAAEQHGRTVRGFTSDAILAIESYAWPGNIRELENRVNRAVIMTENPMVTCEDLGLVPGEANPFPTLKMTRDNAEKEALDHALSVCSGNLSKAAELLGISRPTLYDLLKRHRLLQV
ncbi:PEP-CTERM-box response regulator transcription factor [Acidihalobacter ferrooxydans]|uniref:PEP-CTERM-box response regulator transcription factor n=1 Tax=Acidihalobacter ferrooxydans TaxID=1765967 RepID=A0A1P8UGK0_9GAMM|nr:PEP-CTERM-box response regulator transcription factor [Acidihalobacter ferrooxydans]APZ42977.1 PEP-CTERM-box response regulator transcription factor [Acidihalobacter ferrooxydans]